MSHAKPLVRILACLFLLVGLPGEIAARKKKKSKQKPLFCRRGRLIFEDDFSGKELDWTFNAQHCEWKIVKGALVTRSVGGKAQLSVERAFPAVDNAVFELRIFLPTECTVAVVGAWTNFPFARISSAHGKISLQTWSKEAGVTEVAMEPFPLQKDGWIDVLYEMAGPKYALTVNGKSISCEMPFEGKREINKLAIRPEQKTAQLFMVDDVSVRMAVPKRR